MGNLKNQLSEYFKDLPVNLRECDYAILIYLAQQFFGKNKIPAHVWHERLGVLLGYSTDTIRASLARLKRAGLIRGEVDKKIMGSPFVGVPTQKLEEDFALLNDKKATFRDS